MRTITLKCLLQRCNIDGTLEMDLEKCVLKNNSPCYYLNVIKEEISDPNDIWKKFDNFIAQKQNKR